MQSRATKLANIAPPFDEYRKTNPSWNDLYEMAIA
jgi:hypothetical protein